MLDGMTAAEFQNTVAYLKRRVLALGFGANGERDAAMLDRLLKAWEIAGNCPCRSLPRHQAPPEKTWTCRYCHDLVRVGYGHACGPVR